MTGHTKTLFLAILAGACLTGSMKAQYRVEDLNPDDNQGIPLAINEFMASNSNSNRDPQGQYDDWVEIYNFGTDAIDIGGMYLTDNLSVATRWRIPDNNPAATVIPAGGYLLIWADNDTTDPGLHANFKLDAGGEEIGLFDADGVTLIDSIAFGEQTPDISYGRYPDAGYNRRFFGFPSPAAQNVQGHLGLVADTKFSHNRGFYDESFSLTIATETEGAVIYYTLDGRAPYDVRRAVPVGAVYNGPVRITTTTSVRAMAFKPGWMPTDMDAQTYIFLEDVLRQATHPSTQAQVVPHGCPASWGSVAGDYQVDPDIVGHNSLDNRLVVDDMLAVPTISLVMYRNTWFGSRGIYTNKSQDGTERVASMEFIDPAGGDEFQINCAIAMQGGVSGGGTSLNRWKTAKLSMRPRFKAYADDGTPTGGPSKLDFRMFGDSPTERFDTIVLDAVLNHSWLHPGSGQRNTVKYIQDQYVADLHNAMGGHSPHAFFAHVYISGLYWGLYYVHERPDHSWAAETFGGDKEEYDAIKHNAGGVINDGIGGSARTNYNTMVSAAGAVQSDPTNLAKYQALTRKLDIDNFITYLLTNWFCGNHDWPHKNWYATHRNHPDGRWRFGSWDAEHSLEGGNDVGESPSDIHNKLRGNAEYRLRFADQIHRHFFNGGALTYPNTANMYEMRMAEIDRAIVGESARWGDNRKSTPYTRTNWLNFQNNNMLKNFFPGHSTTVLGWLKNAGLYPNINAPAFRINGSNLHGGQISKSHSLSMTAASGAIWYTLDGSDPRRPAESQQGRTISATLVAENDTKRVLVPTGPISPNWKSGGVYNDSIWRICAGSPGGVGYERSSGYEQLITLDLEGQMYAKNATCYIRIPFMFSGSSDDFNFMTLNIRRDDGFVAYLNGTEVARRNFSGTPSRYSSADASNSDSAAARFENVDISNSLNALRQGSNLLAIHGLNTSTTSSDFLISVELVAGKGASPGSSGMSPNAIQYTGPIELPHSAAVKARVLNANTWSALNEAVFAVGPVAGSLRITEIMYHPQEPNEEFIELTNVGAENINLNLVSFTDGIDFILPSVELAPGERTVVVRDRNAFEAKYGANVNIAGQYSGSLDNAGEAIRLEDAVGRTILDFSYKDGWRSLTDGEGFSLTLIDPGSWDRKESWRASTYAGGSPGGSDNGIIPNPRAVVINELLAHSHAEASDWIELHNTTGTTIDIGGWFLSDSRDNLTKYVIAGGTAIAPREYIVFHQDLHFGNTNDPGCLEPFALSENGERLYLSSAQDGVLTGYRDVQDFGASATGVSFGRYYKSSTDNYNFVAMEQNTPGSANAYPKVGPIVIREIMYNPDWPTGGSYTNDQYEYIEIRNISAEPVTLYRDDKALPWKFTDGIDFTFPADAPSTIPSWGYLLVVKDPAAFSWRYPGVPAEKILGPYDGKLSNAGEKLELSMPGDVDSDGRRHYIRIDRINYSDGSHPQDSPGSIDLWPTDPDGYGKALIRKVPADYGNDPDNWIVTAPSPDG